MGLRYKNHSIINMCQIIPCQSIRDKDQGDIDIVSLYSVSECSCGSCQNIGNIHIHYTRIIVTSLPIPVLRKLEDSKALR